MIDQISAQTSFEPAPNQLA